MKFALLRPDERMDMRRLLRCCRQLQEHGPVADRAGICFNISCLLGAGHRSGTELIQQAEKLMGLLSKWKPYSGDLEYPLGKGRKSYSRSGVVRADWFGRLHEQRIQLLDHMVKVLTEYIGKPEVPGEGEENVQQHLQGWQAEAHGD